jgi:hypothetical protein
VIERSRKQGIWGNVQIGHHPGANGAWMSESNVPGSSAGALWVGFGVGIVGWIESIFTYIGICLTDAK